MSVYHNIYQTQIDNKKAEVAERNTAALFTIWFSYFQTMVSTFKWKNLPKNILPFMPEQQLIYWGMNAFFEDEGQFKIYPCFMGGELLENGQYSKYNIIAKNGKTWIKDISEIEICYNNSMNFPSIWLINELAEKSSYSLRSVDVALERSMMKPIINCKDEAQAQMLSQLYNKKDNLMPFATTFSDAFTNGDINITKFFDNREYDVLALWDTYVRYRNLFYTTIGINNVEIQKRERLTEAEGSGNDEITRYSLLDDMFEQRTDFIKRVKEHFNYDLELEVNRDGATVYELSLTNQDKIEAIQMANLKGVNLTGQEDSNSTEKAEDKEKRNEDNNK